MIHVGCRVLHGFWSHSKLSLLTSCSGGPSASYATLRASSGLDSIRAIEKLSHLSILVPRTVVFSSPPGLTPTALPLTLRVDIHARREVG